MRTGRELSIRSEGLDGCQREIARAEVAYTRLAKAVGLLGRAGLRNGSGLLLWSCRAIHTAFMLFPIDVVFVDEQFTVVGICPCVRPFRAVIGPKRTCHVLELPCGAASQVHLAIGNHLLLIESEG